MLQCLGYVSHATTAFTAADIEKILISARRFNAEHGITGVLCYHEGQFLQFLEGDDADLTLVKQRIQADARHSGIKVVFKDAIENRLFTGWSMAVRGLSDIPDHLQSDCLNLLRFEVPDDLTLPVYRIKVRGFLAAFKESLP